MPGEREREEGLGQDAGPLKASSHQATQLETEQEHRGWASEPGAQAGREETSGP